MKSRNLDGTIIKVTAPSTANTMFAVPHGLGKVPRDMLILARSHSTAQLYRSSALTGAGVISSTDFVGGWEMETGAGLIADSGPNGYTLTNNNIVTSVAGKVGNGGNFVAASAQSLSRASEAGLQFGDIDFTVAAWIKMTTHTANMVVLSKLGVGNAEFQLIYNFGADRFLLYVYKAGGVAVTANDTTVPANGTWYLLIGWHNAATDTVNIQVNNAAPITTATGASLQAPGTGNLGIGYRGLAASELYFNGVIDQAMIWKRVLTTAERTALYNSGNGIAVSQVSNGISVPDAWDATNAYLKCSSAFAEFHVLFFC